MKNYFKYFRIWFAAIAILAIALILINVTQSTAGNAHDYVRNNTECTTEERVFDYGNVLTDNEEQKLRALIAKREQQVGCDIVIVTLNESLENYASTSSNGYSYVNEYVKIYADDFYDQHKFGFDQPNGDGAIYVDNWYRESDGGRYCWFSTSGKVMDKYSSDAMVNMLVNKVLEFTNISPYYAYKIYINSLYHNMAGSGAFTIYISTIALVIFTFAMALIYTLVHIGGNRKSKTTIPTTYVNGGKPQINNQQDLLISKNISQRRIETNTGGGGGGGGGGGHMSGGGFSHGGGGGSH